MLFSFRKVLTVSSVISPSVHTRSPVRIHSTCSRMKNTSTTVKICCLPLVLLFSGAGFPMMLFLCAIRPDKINTSNAAAISASSSSVTAKKDHPSRQPAKWATSVSPMMIRQPLISKSDIRKVMFSPGARSVDPGRLSIALNRYHLTIFIGT